APTASSSGTALPRQVDPHVEVCASATSVKVGQTIMVLGQAVDIGLPDYLVLVQDQGAANGATLADITFDNHLRSQNRVTRVLELASVEAHNDRLAVSLRARAAGQTELTVAAQGEVHYGYPGPATNFGSYSSPITITVTAP